MKKLALSIFFISNAIASVNHETIISQAMAFPFNQIIDRYIKDTGVSLDQALQHEKELKRFLIACALHPDRQFPMGSEIIDELWHTFILFTQEYNDFCMQVAEKFLHHAPTVDFSEQAKTDAVAAYKDFRRTYKAIFHEKAPTAIWPSNLDYAKCNSTGGCSAGGGGGNCKMRG